MTMTQGISKTRSKDVEEDSELLDMIFVQSITLLSANSLQKKQEYMANNRYKAKSQDPQDLDLTRQENSFGGLLVLSLSLTCRKEIS